MSSRKNGATSTERTAEIYLILRNDGSPAYVGCASDAEKRLARHWRERNYDQRRHQPLAIWLRTLTEPPALTHLSFVPWERRDEAEQRWISFYQERGFDLLNRTSGGHGFSGYTRSPEAESRRVEALRLARQQETEEQRSARSAAITRGRTGVRLSPEMAKRVGKKKGVPMTPEERMKRGYKDKPVPDNAKTCDVCPAGPFKGLRGLKRHKEQKHGIFTYGEGYSA